MSPAIAIAQPCTKPCPAAAAAARPVIGSTPKLTRTRPSGPRAPASVPPACVAIRRITPPRRARGGTQRPIHASVRRMGSKVNASTTSDRKYSPAMTGGDTPALRAINTPAGMPPPIGTQKSRNAPSAPTGQPCGRGAVGSSIEFQNSSDMPVRCAGRRRRVQVERGAEFLVPRDRARRMAIASVDDADDPRLAPYRDLRSHDARRRAATFVAESRQVVRALLESRRFRVRSALLTRASLDALSDALRPHGDLPVYVAPLPVLKRVVGFDFHRGCVALGDRGTDATLADVLATGARRLVVLEGASNPDNVGGVLRAARALGAEAVVLSPDCCDPLYRKAVRVS